MRERLFSCFRPLASSPMRHAASLGGLLVIALLHAPGALALGLGDITLRSALNQPFKADIELLDAAGLDESDVMASLATQEEFAKAGVERVFFLNDLRFTPDFRGARKVIHVTSSKVVTEPYLNFLIQVSRPNGQLMREFTVLLDPPGSAQAPVAAAAEAPPARTSANAAPARPPAAAAPAPSATQGKRYTIAQGDSLWTIGKSLQASGTPGSTEQLIRGIRALNPGSEPLQVGKSLLLPDSAVLSTDPVAKAAAVQSAAAPDGAPAANPNALNERLLELENQLALKDQQLAALATQLADAKTAPANPAPITSTPAAPAVPANAVVPTQPAPTQPTQAAPEAPASAVAPAQPQPTQATPTAPASTAVADNPAALSPVPQPMDDEGLPWWQILAVVVLLALLVALLLINRRNKRVVPAKVVAAEPQARGLVRPAQRAPVPEPVAPVVPAAAPVAAVQAPVPARRESPAATDALDGASIYIAYGRFNEALGILREGLAKQPHRTDLHVRMLEVLGQQGNAEGFAVEEAHLRKSGFDPLQLDEIRARYPQVGASGASPQRAEPGLAALAALAAASAAAASAPKPEAVEPAGQQEDPIGEFQLNLDDFTLDADLGLVSPFEAPAPTPVEATDSLEEDLIDEGFLETDLNTFPDVQEVADEGLFLSDLDADAGEGFLQVDPPAESLDDAFLDGFIDADDLPELDALTVDFDDLESQQMSAQLLEEAQTHIDSGNLTAASKLLHDLLRDGDDSCKHTARQLLASIE